MRKLLFLGLSVLYMLIATFCEYTPDVLAHVTDQEKYISIDVEIYSANYQEDGYSYFYVRLLNFEHYKGFSGEHPEHYNDDTLQNTLIKLKILPENAKILLENGFFDTVKEGDIISVRTTCWMHNGLNHHYVAEVNLNGQNYLPFEVGFQNMMDASMTLKKLDYKDILN